MPRISEERIYNLIGSIYDCAKDSSVAAWNAVYEDFANLVQSGPGGLWLLNEKAGRFNFFVSTVPPEMLKLYAEHYQSVSPFYKVLVNMKAGERISRLESAVGNDFEKTEIYEVIYKPQNIYEIEHHTIFNCPGLKAGISFSRPKNRLAFDHDERKAISVVVPHLTRAFKVHHAFAEVKLENMAMADSMRQSSRSVIVLDKWNRPVFINDSAQKLIDTKDGFELDRDGSIRASNSFDTRVLRRALRAIHDPSLLINSSDQSVIQIGRRNETRPFQLVIGRVSGQEWFLDENERFASIFIYDPDAQILTNEALLCQFYGLTLAEAHLTAILAEGKSLNEACDLLTVTQNTARTHLKRIFSKTDTNRQTELVKLVIAGMATRVIDHQSVAN